MLSRYIHECSVPGYRSRQSSTGTVSIPTPFAVAAIAIPAPVLASPRNGLSPRRGWAVFLMLFIAMALFGVAPPIRAEALSPNTRELVEASILFLRENGHPLEADRLRELLSKGRIQMRDLAGGITAETGLDSASSMRRVILLDKLKVSMLPDASKPQHFSVKADAALRLLHELKHYQQGADETGRIPYTDYSEREAWGAAMQTSLDWIVARERELATASAADRARLAREIKDLRNQVETQYAGLRQEGHGAVRLSLPDRSNLDETQVLDYLAAVNQQADQILAGAEPTLSPDRPTALDLAALDRDELARWEKQLSDLLQARGQLANDIGKAMAMAEEATATLRGWIKDLERSIKHLAEDAEICRNLLDIERDGRRLATAAVGAAMGVDDALAKARQNVCATESDAKALDALLDHAIAETSNAKKLLMDAKLERERLGKVDAKVRSGSATGSRSGLASDTAHQVWQAVVTDLKAENPMPAVLLKLREALKTLAELRNRYALLDQQSADFSKALGAEAAKHTGKDWATLARSAQSSLGKSDWGWKQARISPAEYDRVKAAERELPDRANELLDEYLAHPDKDQQCGTLVAMDRAIDEAAYRVDLAQLEVAAIEELVQACRDKLAINKTGPLQGQTRRGQTEPPGKPAQPGTKPGKHVPKPPIVCNYLILSPQGAEIAPNRSIRFTAIAVFDDGSRRDVTMAAAWQSSTGTAAQVSPRQTRPFDSGSTYTAPGDSRYNQNMTITARWGDCEGTTTLKVLAAAWTPPISHADDRGARGAAPEPSDFVWYVLCDTTGHVVTGKDTNPTQFGIMAGPFPGPRNAEQWIPRGCPSELCAKENAKGVCAKEPPLAATGGDAYYALCNDSGRVVISRSAALSGHVRLANAPALSGEAGARAWIEKNCPTWECTGSGGCASAGQIRLGGKWAVVCGKRHGGVGFTEYPNSVDSWVWAEHLLTDGDARKWIAQHCPSERCDQNGRCLAGNQPLGAGRPVEVPPDAALELFRQRDRSRQPGGRGGSGATIDSGARPGRFTGGLPDIGGMTDTATSGGDRRTGGDGQSGGTGTGTGGGSSGGGSDFNLPLCTTDRDCPGSKCVNNVCTQAPSTSGTNTAKSEGWYLYELVYTYTNTQLKKYCTSTNRWAASFKTLTEARAFTGKLSVEAMRTIQSYAPDARLQSSRLVSGPSATMPLPSAQQGQPVSVQCK